MEETRFYSANENAIEWERGTKRATVTFSEPRMINKIRKLAKDHPEVEILADGSENGGYCYAHIPSSWIKIKAPARLPSMSEEQKRELAERFGVLSPKSPESLGENE